MFLCNTHRLPGTFGIQAKIRYIACLGIIHSQSFNLLIVCPMVDGSGVGRLFRTRYPNVFPYQAMTLARKVHPSVGCFTLLSSTLYNPRGNFRAWTLNISTVFGTILLHLVFSIRLESQRSFSLKQIIPAFLHCMKISHPIFGIWFSFLCYTSSHLNLSSSLQLARDFQPNLLFRVVGVDLAVCPFR